jgi:hypothetical protein
MKRIALTLIVALPLFAATPRNDDTCDVGVLPAATLLLPYFEVDVNSRHGATTFFSITNTTHHEQIAHVTLWTDRAYPVLDFDIFLTGYDVQEIDLYDVLALAQIAPPWGTGYHVPGSPEGDFSSDDANPSVDEKSCRSLPSYLGEEVRERLRLAFTRGIGGQCERIGGVHANAIGYATIDVVRHCGAPTAQEPGFVDALLFDNVLTGEYRQISASRRSAQGAPLVHIRAIPEGGGETALPETFYSAFQSGRNRTRDLRQPLPSAFAARTTDDTKLKVWRASESGAVRACDVYSINGELPVIDAVHFDENRNALPYRGELPEAATSLVDTHDGAGWTYLNLGAQAWVISSIGDGNEFGTDVEATALGNGCSPAFEAGAAVAPAHDFNAVSLAPPNTNNDDACDIAVLPAATLLLPYFSVDPNLSNGDHTEFTLTNVSAAPRIAHVTLWTDLAWPVFSFNVLLGGYDSQRIDLNEILVAGRVPASCGALPRELPSELRARMLQALTTGKVPALGDQPACSRVGTTDGHPNLAAVGYATIDVVNTCTPLDATHPEYWDAIAYDNVLTGDYRWSNDGRHSAEGAPLVHIRAVPEGGRVEPPFARTFYSRYQRAATPNRDARQPLPSIFAARFLHQGTGWFETFVNVWREGETGTNATCSLYEANLMLFAELVAFDEEENAWGKAPELCPVTCIHFDETLAATGSYRYADEDDDTFPNAGDATGGWLYLNLTNDLGGDYASQAWVTTSLRAGGRFAVSLDAAALGNGCTPIIDKSEVSNGGWHVIGPAENKQP